MNEAGPDAAFYEAVGRALTAWSGVEACLTSLFQVCFDTVLANSSSLSRSGFSGRVLDAVDGVGVRVKMVDEALSGVLSSSDLDIEDSAVAQQILSEWIELRKLVMNDLVKRRNKLAHWSVYVTWDSDANTRRPILVPHENSFKRHELLRDQNFSYDEDFVVECRIIFEEVQQKLDGLFRRIAERGFGILAQLDNMRAALHFWGAEVEPLCERLREPYASSGSN